MPRAPLYMRAGVSKSACMHVTDRTEDVLYFDRETVRERESGRAAHNVPRLRRWVLTAGGGYAGGC
jgi:hypothetical protein